MKRRATLIGAAIALLLIAAASADEFARTVAALASGVAATGKSDRVRAGRVLLATGAVPLDGDDLANSWAGSRTLSYRDRALGPGYRTVAVMAGGTAPSGRCSWMPLWTTRYGIDVSNPGRMPGRYYMVVQ